MKKNLKPTTALAPVPAVMVSCGTQEEANIITLAWVGTVNSEPPIVSISVRYPRHSFPIIERTGEFTVNLVTEELVTATDLCGTRSGRDTDKFQRAGLTKGKGVAVSCPYIVESPVSLECKVIKRVDFPTHAVFFGEIVNIVCDEKYVNAKEKITLPDSLLVAYSGGKYVKTGKEVAPYGYSAKK